MPTAPLAPSSDAEDEILQDSDVSQNGDEPAIDHVFRLPGGEPALFLLNIRDGNRTKGLTERITQHGGQITHSDAQADVILVDTQEAYKLLKDKYAISNKTHVRLSGFVVRCIEARKFTLVPLVEKGIPGRQLNQRRVSFTKEDDRHLCEYIAEVLPFKEEGGRTGHFIYQDLLRRAEEFSQYEWASRHTHSAWRERYRKNRRRLDEMIDQIVEENGPPAPDDKRRYRYRRHGRRTVYYSDDEYSPTDGRDDPVPARSENAEPQEEEEEEEEGGEEEAHKQTMTTRRPAPSDGSRAPKRRKILSRRGSRRASS
ncbi:hypothetical protein BC834DRAFT_429644 [Gloeopeniophorella convolvens]|nr:hypothetical protein BC834DRAFT_429644 [Gloeopeniophorella convolvens]